MPVRAAVLASLSETDAIRQVAALPPVLFPFASAALAGLDAGEIEEALVTEYAPGAGIGWHRDAPMFGSTVIGISLGAAAEMRFRPGTSGRTAFAALLEPRSAYILSGDARSKWQHMIPPMKATRYSITFRMVKESWKRR